MTKSKKVDLLYKKAHGQSLDLSKEEAKELRKYKVDYNEDKAISTKVNLGAYVAAVDKGARSSFYDWCLNHNKADRRRKGCSEEGIKEFNREQSIGVAFMGWLVWGMAIYWTSNGAVSVGESMMAGVV